MEQETERRDEQGQTAYDKQRLMKKFGIGETEFKMALGEIHYGTPQQLEDYLKLKYQAQS